jgi:endonuclease/exonuclease/phosphatase family metal-dependent hydrolase
LSISQEILLEMPARSLPPGFLCLQTLERRLLGLPVLNLLRPVARRAMAVAEPAGRLSIRTLSEPIHGQNTEGITVLSANLCHDWPRYRRLHERLEDFARLVETRAADILLLQEVARTPKLRADEWLSDRLGMGYIYSRANGRAGYWFEEDWRFQPLPARRTAGTALDRSNPFMRRLALGATMEAPCGKLLTFSVHLGLLRQQNANQLAHLRHWVSRAAGELPALVGGDFNAHETSPQITQVRSTWLDTFRCLHPQADGTTHKLRWPWGGILHQARLDYIFLHNEGQTRWRMVEAHHLDAPDGPHSDHRAVLARLVPAAF